MSQPFLKMEREFIVSFLQLFIKGMNGFSHGFYLLPTNLAKLPFRKIELKEFVGRTFEISLTFHLGLILRLQGNGVLTKFPSKKETLSQFASFRVFKHEKAIHWNYSILSKIYIAIASAFLQVLSFLFGVCCPKFSMPQCFLRSLFNNQANFKMQSSL